VRDELWVNVPIAIFFPSHTVFPGILQANLIHLSSKMATPHNHGRTGFSKSPSHPLLSRFFALAPIKARPEREKALRTRKFATQAVTTYNQIFDTSCLLIVKVEGKALFLLCTAFFTGLHFFLDLCFILPWFHIDKRLNISNTTIFTYITWKDSQRHCLFLQFCKCQNVFLHVWTILPLTMISSL